MRAWIGIGAYLVFCGVLFLAFGFGFVVAYYSYPTTPKVFSGYLFAAGFFTAVGGASLIGGLIAITDALRPRQPPPFRAGPASRAFAQPMSTSRATKAGEPA